MSPLRMEEIALTMLDAAMKQQNAIWPDAPRIPCDGKMHVLTVGTDDGRRFFLLTKPKFNPLKCTGESTIDQSSEACDIIDALMDCIEIAERKAKENS